jgi:Ca2+-binding RTX toxin-like protein
VALGDSVAARPDSYVYHLFGFLRTAQGGALDTLHNRSRGGDDSGTLRTGGQLATAIADIDRPSDTEIVTIDIGGNDRFGCGSDPGRPTWHLATCPFAANFAATLADLEVALGRDPGSESLVAMTYYNPASGTGSAQEGDYDRGLLGTDLRIFCAPGGDARLGLNDRIACISRSHGALVADVHPAFKLGGQALIADGIHPNGAGQAVIAAEFRTALGKPGPWPPPATAGDDRITGTPENDRLCGLGGSDVIFGLAGNDTLLGDACGAMPLAARTALAAAAAGHDSLVGGTGDDRLRGAGGRDALRGNAGNDLLVGGRGDDGLAGSSGRDRLDAGPGDDRLNGGNGRDKLTAGPGNDMIDTRDGTRDTVDCGRGRKDKTRVDLRDRLRRCEGVRRTAFRRVRL